ncbi:UNVERIFIED_ORG: hypothetical protein J2X79_001968 [Arthrobacter globiformis]|nr:hypothetical protein [Arthrobacter globiformis]
MRSSDSSQAADHEKPPTGLRDQWSAPPRGSSAPAENCHPEHVIWRPKLEGGREVRFGVWIAIHPDDLQHACRVWNTPEYIDLKLSGYLANKIQPWGLLAVPVKLAVVDPNRTPYCVSSPDEDLNDVLTKDWSHDSRVVAIRSPFVRRWGSQNGGTGTGSTREKQRTMGYDAIEIMAFWMLASAPKPRAGDHRNHLPQQETGNTVMPRYLILDILDCLTYPMFAGGIVRHLFPRTVSLSC